MIAGDSRDMHLRYIAAMIAGISREKKKAAFTLPEIAGESATIIAGDSRDMHLRYIAAMVAGISREKKILLPSP